MTLEIKATTLEEHTAFLLRTHQAGTIWAYRESGQPDDLLRVVSREGERVVYSWYRGAHDELTEGIGPSPLTDFRVGAWDRLVLVTEAEWIAMLLAH